MLRFSSRLEYGLQAVLELAAHYDSGTLQIRDVAKDCKIPIRYLEQLLLILKRAGILSSQRGVDGGYILAKHPGSLKLLEIVEALEGPIELVGKKTRSVSILNDAFNKIQDELREALGAVTIEDLHFKKKQKERAFNYSI